ncbi:ABC transporter permease [Mycolicibacterium duvalii]|uniref:Doxorubicin resistance ABC transporter permease DrrB n=1 Tax=Mycolicibacterium duvalii TaxID=39688 RepID=A0A7I7JYY5_9MYCO|nr:ABC transporter permease [Mycolicibacterium duvalii]BBX16449.1 doxorubicin resistance ABC transporter permease DrrB [Mycolicibacterium duvalii]
MTSSAVAGLGARPQTSAIQQWWVLTVRMITPSLRNGEIATLVAGSIMFTVGFYIPLKEMTGSATGMSSYAQFLTPMVVIVAITFAAVSAAFRSASDAGLGINRRFKAMPIPALIPLSSRMSACLYRCTVAMVVSLACGHVIGFRFHNGVVYIAAFCGLALLVGFALSILGDFIGTSTENPEATTHLIMLPQLIFGFLSVGVQPVERFPEWIQPFVRNQPVSQFVYALRALAGDTTSAVPPVSWSVIGPSLIWAVGIIAVLIPLHGLVATRRQ